MLLCVPLNILLSDYFKDGDNRREFNAGLYFEGQVGLPPTSALPTPSHPIEHSYLAPLLK